MSLRLLVKCDQLPAPMIYLFTVINEQISIWRFMRTIEKNSFIF